MPTNEQYITVIHRFLAEAIKNLIPKTQYTNNAEV